MSELSPEDLFVLHLEKAESDSAPDLELLIARHPEHAGELRRLNADWNRVTSIVERIRGSEPRSRRVANQFDLEPSRVILEKESAAREDGDVQLDELFGRSARFGRYRLKDVVGRNAKTTVLRVWDSDLKRHLAMKLRGGAAAPPAESGGHSGTDSSQAIRSFLNEAQITGQLDHPGVVPVHEVGLDARGTLYFTMRLVDGENFERVIERVEAGEPDWSLERALGLLLKACEALAYAHAKGVIHRDLKAANIAVGRFGEVYVMDWGRASLLNSVVGDPGAAWAEVGEDESLVQTAGSQDYSAPEVARSGAHPIGPPADVFSIGAILYHLLAGQPPRSVAATPNRAVSPSRISDVAPGRPSELIAICERAMAREPEDRYANVERLAEDLRAFIENRVVRAYRTGPIHELKKWMERNRALAAAALATLAVVVGGSTTVAVVLAQKNEDIARATADALAARSDAADAERTAFVDAERARSERTAADRVASFLESLFRSSDPWVREELEPLNALDLLRTGAARINSGLQGAPLVRARLSEAIGKSLGSLGATREALPLVEQAYVLREGLDGSHADTTHRAALEVAEVKKLTGRYEQAESLLRMVFDHRSEHATDELFLRAALDLGVLLNQLGRFDDAEPFVQAAEAGYGALAGQASEEIIETALAKGALLLGQGRASDGVAHLRAALARSALSDAHPLQLRVRASLAALLANSGQHAEAQELVRATRPMVVELAGAEHEIVATLDSVLVASLTYQDRHAEALGVARAALDTNLRVRGAHHEFSIKAMSNLAAMYSNLGRAEEAERLARDAVNNAVDSVGEQSLITAHSLSTLANIVDVPERLDEAAELLQRCLSTYRAVVGPEAAPTLTALNNLLSIRLRQGRVEEVVAGIGPVYAGRRAALNDRDRLRPTLSVLLSAYHRAGRFEEGVQFVRGLAQGPDGRPGELEWVDQYIARKRTELGGGR